MKTARKLSAGALRATHPTKMDAEYVVHPSPTSEETQKMFNKLLHDEIEMECARQGFAGQAALDDSRPPVPKPSEAPQQLLIERLRRLRHVPHRQPGVAYEDDDPRIQEFDYYIGAEVGDASVDCVRYGIDSMKALNEIREEMVDASGMTDRDPDWAR